MKNRILIVPSLLLLLVINVLLFMYLANSNAAVLDDSRNKVAKSAFPNEELTGNYQTTLDKIDRWKGVLNGRYLSAVLDGTVEDFYPLARTAFIEIMVNQIMPYWYGTSWDYLGDTEVPGEGAIACGYFVSTVLRDGGLAINRIKLAQLESEEMIRNLTTEEHIRRYRNTSFDDFLTDLKMWGNGLYVIGLDYHAGFIYQEKDKRYFIHSSYSQNAQVLRELADSSVILRESRYRVLGKISEDEELLKKWVTDS